MSKNSIPAVRFCDFSDNWESKKIGDLGSVSMNKRIFKDETSETGEVPFYKIGTFGSEPDSFITREKFEEYKSKYPYPEIGDILISASGSIGRTVEYHGEEAYFQDSNIVWLKHDERLNNSFLKQFYSIVKWEGIEGTTIKRLYNKNILETPISFPSPAEQSAIGTLFRTLDDLLSSYKDNLANYQSLKATMLSKMFPKAGQTVPEIRLDGFEGEWEEKEFIQIVNRVTESSDSDSLPKVEFEDIISGQGKLNKDISSKFDNRKGILFKPGYTLYGKLRPYLNNWLLPKFEGVALGDFWVFDPNGNNSDFIYYLVQSSRYQKVANDTSGTKMPRSDWKSVSTTIFAIPQTIAEQQAIGAYFSNLDNLINSHQEKISQLEILKKKLLQDMFI